MATILSNNRGRQVLCAKHSSSHQGKMRGANIVDKQICVAADILDCNDGNELVKKIFKQPLKMEGNTILINACKK
jgi:hypothetical protein